MGSELGVDGDTKPQIPITPVTIWWACWACVWTTAVVLGMAILIARRNSPVLRFRGLGLSLSAIVLLHLYWISVQLGLMVAPLMPGDAEYWIMGTYLPCGIALFHASNSRLLHVAKLQTKFVQPSNHLAEFPRDSKRKGNLIDRFRRLDYTVRVIILVSIGMFSQVFLTCLMYIISRKWHSSWGIPGTAVHGTPMEKKAQMGRGWEWWPGVFWQFLWAWVIAPIILWKSRKIHDTMGWRVQTIGCAVANLHATPMWLIALYVPGMAPVNQYWIPPQWICLSIFFMEIFTVFLPCWEVLRHSSLHKETLDAIAQWEAKSKGTGSIITESTLVGGKSTAGSAETSGTSVSIMTMGALEHALEHNPAPLQEFSALRDLSGENIAFLMSVTEWKRSQPKAAEESSTPSDNNNNNAPKKLHGPFNEALRIYVEFISPRYAEFPVNISSQDCRKLEQIFEGPARTVYGDKRDSSSTINPATPFAFDPPSSPTASEGSDKAMQMSVVGTDADQYWGDIPEAFDEAVFDDAEQSIKYLVLTNTWPKYVRDCRSSMSSSSARSLEAGFGRHLPAS